MLPSWMPRISKQSAMFASFDACVGTGIKPGWVARLKNMLNISRIMRDLDCTGIGLLIIQKGLLRIR